jgi:hypothetical protein
VLGALAKLSEGEAVVKRIAKLTTELLRYLQSSDGSISDFAANDSDVRLKA